MGKRFAVGAAATSALMLLAACGTAPTAAPRGPSPTPTTARVSSGAPHLVVCGQTLSTSAAGPVADDIASHTYPPVTDVTVGGVIYVQVSNSCTSGAAVKLTPPEAFETARTVRATDGRTVLVELRPNAHPVAVLSATTEGPVGKGDRVVFLKLHLVPVGVFHRPVGGGPVSQHGPVTITVPATAAGALGTIVGRIDACAGTLAPAIRAPLEGTKKAH